MKTKVLGKRNHSEVVRLAYRLAAQAVIAWDQGPGPRLKAVRLKTGVESLTDELFTPVPVWANYNHGDCDELAAKAWRQEFVMVLYAGEIGAVLPYRGTPDFTPIEGKLIDLANAVCSSPRCARLWLRWMQAETEQFLSREWPRYVVPKLADELLAGRAVDYDKYQEILHTRPLSNEMLRELRLTPMTAVSETEYVRSGVC